MEKNPNTATSMEFLDLVSLFSINDKADFEMYFLDSEILISY